MLALIIVRVMYNMAVVVNNNVEQNWMLKNNLQLIYSLKNKTPKKLFLLW